MNLRSRKTFTTLLLLILIGVVYQNCMNSGSPGINSLYTAATVENLRTLDTEEKNQICEDPENYVCTQRFYLPGGKEGKIQETQCFIPSGMMTEMCTIVTVIRYDTTGAIAQCRNCSKKDQEPGGRYNYEESFCYNKDLYRRTLVDDRMDSSKIEFAFESAFQACRRLLDVDGSEVDE